MALRLNPQTGQLEDDGTGQPMASPQELEQAYQQGPPPAPPQALPPQMPVAPPPMPPVAPPRPPPMIRDTSTTSSTREVPRPEEAALMRRQTAADEAGIGIAGQQGAALQAKSATEAEAARMRSTARQGFEPQTTAVVDQGAADMQKAKGIYDAENQRLVAMGDPKGFWETRSTGQKVAAAIALAMGAIGGALTGRGGNAAMDVINHAVETDYRLQMAKIQQQEKRVSAAKEGVGMARQSAADAREQLELKQAARWNTLGAYAEQKAAEVGTQNAAATAAAIKNAAEEKRNEHLMKWYEGQRSKVTSTNTNVSGTGVAGAAQATQTAIFDLKGNPVGNALRPDEAEKIRAGQAATNSLLATIEDIKRFNGGHNWATRKGPDAQKQAEALTAAGAGYLTTMYQSGVLNQGEFDRYKSFLQPGMLQGSEGANKTLEIVRDGAERAYNNRVRSQGVKLPEAAPQQQGPAGGTPAGVSQQFMGGARLVTQRSRLTGETRKAWVLPDGRVIPAP